MFGQIGKWTSSGVKYASKYSSKFASKTVKVFAENTPVGKRIMAGYKEALKAVETPFQAENSSSVFASLKENAVSGTKKLFQDSLHDEKLNKLFTNYLGKMNIATDFSKLDNVGILQRVIESAGVGPTKLAQIISDNVEIMHNIRKQIVSNPLLDDLQKQRVWKTFEESVRRCRSKGTPSRSIEEVKAYITETFGSGYTLRSDKLKVGSIGETCFVTRPDGKPAVIKMLKKGLNKEKLDSEEKLFSYLLKAFDRDNKCVGILRNYYKNWKAELDFTKEFEFNSLLSAGAQRFKVAKITEIAKDGRALIMDNASGIQMEELMKILKDFQRNPKAFAPKYADMIKNHPWLSNPENVMKQLPSALLKAFDEQFLFVKNGGKSIMHGDPHMGNYFITTNGKGKIIPEFIDTGNCVMRDVNAIHQDIKFFSNYFVGNPHGVAEYLVDTCNYTRANKELITSRVAKEIQKQIFGKAQNVTQLDKIQSSIMNILDKNGLVMPEEAATALKAQIQFLSGITAAGDISGNTISLLGLFSDLPKAAYKIGKTGSNPFKSLTGAINFAYNNQVQASRTASQFFL